MKQKFRIYYSLPLERDNDVILFGRCDLISEIIFNNIQKIDLSKKEQEPHFLDITKTFPSICLMKVLYDKSAKTLQYNKKNCLLLSEVTNLPQEGFFDIVLKDNLSPNHFIGMFQHCVAIQKIDDDLMHYIQPLIFYHYFFNCPSLREISLIDINDNYENAIDYLSMFSFTDSLVKITCHSSFKTFCEQNLKVVDLTQEKFNSINWNVID